MTMTDAPEFFLHYAQHVLGLRHLPQPTRESVQLLILDIPWPDGLNRDEMFQKMMSAVNFDSRDYDILECLPSELSARFEEISSYPLLFSFSHEIADALKHLKTQHPHLQFEVLSAPGPRDLRIDPSQKRRTWEQLKQLRSSLERV